MLYSIAKSILLVLYRLLFRLRAEGLENVPASGPVILASNHVSNLDPPTVGVLLRRKIHFMAKVELFKVPVLGPIITRLGAFPVNRGGVSKEAIKSAISLLDEGKMMAIFPEGSRNNGGAGKKGMALIAHRSGAVIVPAAIVGDYKLFGKTTVVYGRPIDPKAIIDPHKDDPLAQITDAVMNRIRELAAGHK